MAADPDSSCRRGRSLAPRGMWLYPAQEWPPSGGRPTSRSLPGWPPFLAQRGSQAQPGSQPTRTLADGITDVPWDWYSVLRDAHMAQRVRVRACSLFQPEPFDCLGVNRGRSLGKFSSNILSWERMLRSAHFVATRCVPPASTLNSITPSSKRCPLLAAESHSDT